MSDQSTAASLTYSELECRMGNEHKQVENAIHRLVDQVFNNAPISPTLPDKCITIPRRLKSPESNPNQLIHGYVWQWSALKANLHPLFVKLHPLNLCFSGQQNEVCLNPTHYKSPKSSNNPNLERLLSGSPVWAKIAYYERGERIGELFQCQSTCVVVDCTKQNQNPSYRKTQRFSLVGLQNQDRDESIVHTRNQIGRGFAIHYRRGLVFIESLTDCSFLFRGGFVNYFRGFRPLFITSSAGRKSHLVFGDREFGLLIENQMPHGEVAVIQLSQLCKLWLSFDSGVENDLGAAPNCWVEVRLRRQFEWLERSLAQLNVQYKVHF